MPIVGMALLFHRSKYCISSNQPESNPELPFCHTGG